MIIGLIYTILFMAFMWYVSDRVEYLPCVAIYAVGRGIVPLLFPPAAPLVLIVNFVFRFIIGLAFVKLLIKFTYSLDDYRVIIVLLSIIELVLTVVVTVALAAILSSLGI